MDDSTRIGICVLLKDLILDGINLADISLKCEATPVDATTSSRFVRHCPTSPSEKLHLASKKPIRGRTDIPSDCVGSIAVGNGVVYAAVMQKGFFMLPCTQARQEKVDKGVLPKSANYRTPYEADTRACWHVWRPKDVGQVRSAAVRGDTVYVACGAWRFKGNPDLAT